MNVCKAKANAAAWTAVGCVVTTATATGVAGLGTVSVPAATGYVSCAITCPITGGNFVAAKVAKTCTCPNGIPTVATGSAGTLCDVAGVDCSTCSTGYTLSATAAAGGSQICGKPKKPEKIKVGAQYLSESNNCKAPSLMLLIGVSILLFVAL